MYRTTLTIIFSMLVGFAHASQSIIPLDPGFKLEGHSTAELSAAWWKWAMASPDESNPVQDTSGAHCDVDQQGSVWFLAGGFGSSKIKRSCAIPVGKYIFFPIINMAYWQPREVGNRYTCENAKALAAVNNDNALELFVELDGVAVENPKRFRARTKQCFDIFERVPKNLNSYNAYPSASDGYWLLLRPLQKGKHTIKFGGRYPSPDTAYGHMVQDIEYEIFVK